jgi:hypothetical protein
VRTRRAWTVDEFETVAKELNPYYGQKIADDGHTAVECNCDEPYCQFCQGGLFACSVCGGLEGSVPTHCPGDAMTYKQNEDVMFIFDYGFEFTTTAGKALHIEIYADEQTYHAFVRPFPKEHLT